MAISLVQTNSGTGSSQAYSSSNTAGNLLVVFGESFQPLTVSDSKGNTWAVAAQIEDPDSAYFYIWYAKNCAAGANTVTMGGDGQFSMLTLVVMEFSGADTTAPFDVQSTQVVGSSPTSTLSSGAAMTTANGELILGANDNGTGITPSPGSGFTSAALVGTASVIYRIQTSAGSIAATWTAPSSGIWYDALMATFKAAGGATFTKSLTDSITPAETFKKATARRVADTVTLAEGFTRNLARKFTEAVTLAETVKKSTSRKLTETFSLAEVFSAAGAKFLSLSDAFSVSDSLKRATTRKLADTVAVTESLAKATARKLGDTVTLVESIAKATARKFTESITLAELFSASRAKVLNLVDALTPSDSLVKGITRGLTDVISPIESLVRGVGRRLSDAFACTDSISRAIGKRFIEALTLLDSLTRAIARRVVDAVDMADSLVRSLARTFAEVLTLVEHFAFAVGRAGDGVRRYLAQLFNRLFSAETRTRLTIALVANRAWSAPAPMIYADPKDSEAAEKFTIDWSQVATTDPITDSRWEVPEGLTATPTFTTTKANALIAGGSPGQSYVIKNVVTLTSGQVLVQELLLPVD